MIHSTSALQDYLLLVGLSLSLGCGPVEFQAAAPREVSQSASGAQEAAKSELASHQEPLPAVEPTPVDGAFLICRWSPENTDDLELLLQCGFAGDVSKAKDLDYQFRSGLDPVAATELVPLSQTVTQSPGLFVHNFAIRRAQILGPLVFISISDRVQAKKIYEGQLLVPGWISPKTPDPVVVADVKALLDQLTWQMPCGSSGPAPEYCRTSSGPNQQVQKTLRGDPAKVHTVNLRIRGLIETKVYKGGSSDGAYWQVGGTPDNTEWNVYSIVVSDPPATYYLNRGEITSSHTMAKVDYLSKVRVSGGAKVTAVAHTSDSFGYILRNVYGLTFPELTYGGSGQILRIDVVDVQPE